MGENGSGKSSVLEYIFLSYWFYNRDKISTFFQPFPGFDFYTLETLFTQKFNDNKIPCTNYTKLNPNLKVLYIINHNTFSNFLKNDINNKNALRDIGLFNVSDYGFNISFGFNEEEYAEVQKLVDLIIDRVKNIDLDFYNKIFKSDNGKSHGEHETYWLVYNIVYLVKKLNIELLLLEEPIVFGHPSFQKILPKLIQILQQELDTQFLISTHSPFIISEAGKIAEEEKAVGKISQKVYLIEDGQTRDLFGKVGKGTDGYSGGDCVNVVNEMLGSHLNDYFGGLCFLAEKSVCAFLAGLKENLYFKKKLKPFTFILSNNGEDKQRSVEAKELRRQAYSYNGLTENLKLIVDNEPQHTNIFKQYADDYPKSLILLSRDEIETLYGENLINMFLRTTAEYEGLNFKDNINKQHCFKDFCKVSNIQKNIKVDLGKFAGKNIDEETFKLNFPDLHSCIFG